MNQIVDPRTLGFNYGVGWGRAPKPPVYYVGEDIAHQLRQEASRIGAKAWALDMALRNVRLACTDAEKDRAVAALEIALAQHETQNA